MEVPAQSQSSLGDGYPDTGPPARDPGCCAFPGSGHWWHRSLASVLQDQEALIGVSKGYAVSGMSWTQDWPGQLYRKESAGYRRGRRSRGPN